MNNPPPSKHRITITCDLILDLYATYKALPASETEKREKILAKCKELSQHLNEVVEV